MKMKMKNQESNLNILDKIKIICFIIFMGSLTISLILSSIFLIYFPNIPKLVEQINRKSDMNNLVNTTDPFLIEYAEFVRSQVPVEHTEWYIYETFPKDTDFNIYYNFNYWATPSETLQNNRGDCEDLAILVKSVKEYYKKMRYIKNVEVRLVIQTGHLYIQSENQGVKTNYYDMSDEMEEKLNEKIDEESWKYYFNLLPPIRRFLIFPILFFIFMEMCLLTIIGIEKIIKNKSI